MSRLRQGIAAGIVVVLAVVVGVALAQDDPQSPPEALTTSTTVVATTSTVPSSTTSSGGSTTSTTAPQDRVAEVQAILQDLWFRWFDAIYRKDPDALWAVVATDELHDAGVEAMGTMSFESPPSVAGTVISIRRVLLDREDCLVVWHDLDVSEYRGSGARTDAVLVMWPDPRFGWRAARNWVNPGDLWQNDCDVVTRPSRP